MSPREDLAFAAALAFAESPATNKQDPVAFGKAIAQVYDTILGNSKLVDDASLQAVQDRFGAAVPRKDGTPDAQQKYDNELVKSFSNSVARTQQLEVCPNCLLPLYDTQGNVYHGST